MISTVPDTLITTHLEMTDRSQFKPAYVADEAVQIVELEQVSLDEYLSLYRAVGEQWHWRDRLVMDRRELRAVLDEPTRRIFVLLVDGQTAGYVELDQRGAEVEIAYFGLIDGFLGRGLGKHLLSFGVEQAWKLDGVRRVIVHTCNLDGPHALDNYTKRGFRVYHTEHEVMPERYY